VKEEFENEHLFDSSDTITARAVSYRDVLGSLDGFHISYANKETGRAYDSFVHKVLRNFSEEPVIPHVVAEKKMTGDGYLSESTKGQALFIA
jgi:hypothetical protein